MKHHHHHANCFIISSPQPTHLLSNQLDPLSSYRKQFHIPKDKHGNELIYLCGNSLGLQPKSTKEYINQELEDWANLGVEGHIEAKKRLSGK